MGICLAAVCAGGGAVADWSMVCGTAADATDAVAAARSSAAFADAAASSVGVMLRLIAEPKSPTRLYGA